MSNLAECRVLVGGQWKRKGRDDSGGTPGGTTNSPYYGACPPSGGGGASAVRTKFGAGTSVRVFFSGSLTARPTVPAGCSVMHLSYKPTMSSVLNGSLDSQIRSLLDFCQPGWILTFWHERDNDGGLTSADIQQWKNVNNYLYDLKQSYKPSVLTAPVFTGGTMANYTSNSVRDTWCTGLRGDLWGIDCDGVHIRDASHPNETNYNRIQYSDEMANCNAYMAHPSNSGFRQITVAEFITARKNPPDPTGSIRAGWMQDQAAIFEQNECYAVMAYDFNFGTHNTSTDFNEMPSGSPELNAWKALVATNPATPRT